MFLAGKAEEHTDWTALGDDVSGSVGASQSAGGTQEGPPPANQRACLGACGRRGLFASLLHLSVFSVGVGLEIITSGTSTKCGGRADPRGRSRGRVSTAGAGGGGGLRGGARGGRGENRAK